MAEQPKDLMDCFRLLKAMGTAEDLEAFIDLPDRKAAPTYHSGLGRALRNRWGLWHDPKGDRPETPIHAYLVELGLHHGDDMSGLILESFHRHLRGEPLDVKGQVARYQEFWRTNAEANASNGEKSDG